MKTEAPENFDVREFLKPFYIFQEWEIFDGHMHSAPKNVMRIAEGLGLPADLRGKRVLDIAPWNGFFSFECIRRGADQVVSLGPEDPAATGFQKVMDLLEIKNCEYRRGSVYDITPASFGQFDIVLCLGLIYHLRHPLLALDRIFDVCQTDLYVDSPIIDNTVFDKTISPEKTQEILAAKAIHDLPMLYFTKGSETGDPYNWFMPNRAALSSMIEASGFEITHTGDDGGGWAWASARKAERTFTVDLEGYNPNAAAAHS